MHVQLLNEGSDIMLLDRLKLQSLGWLNEIALDFVNILMILCSVKVYVNHFQTFYISSLNDLSE